MTRNWSEYQTAIFAAVETILSSKTDLVILARAGTGKTTTVTEAVIRFSRRNPRAKTLACAFNVKNARDLEAKFSDAGLDWKTASARTLNSVGLATVKKAFGKGVEVDGRKGAKIAKDLARAYDGAPISGLAGKIARLATLSKITLTDASNDAAVSALARRYSVADEDEEIETLVALAREAMERSAAERTVVDFDDQLWFPHIFDLVPWQHDLVVVDEAQDMNPSQLALARKSVKRNGRLVAVGDDRQAIYGWRGADSQFIPRMIEQLRARVLPLPRTYRCGRAIVAAARVLVPDYEAADCVPEGLVRGASGGEMLGKAAVGDFVLSRTNAPLLPICLTFLKSGIPAAIQGRDVMGMLIAMVERSECSTTAELLEWLSDYETAERAKLIAADVEDEVLEVLSDRCACLRYLAGERPTCAALVSHLETLFSDKDELDRITLSTVHRAKGLERDRVWLMSETFRVGGDQENNVMYVAITRARTELVYVK